MSSKSIDRIRLETATRQAGAGQLAALVSRLRGLDRVAWRGDLSSGRPDPRRVAQLAADLTANGCRQRRLTPAPKVALACVIDTSSSMATESVCGSEGCALALADAVRRCGGVAAVGAFHHELMGIHERLAHARVAYPGGGTPLSAGIGGALAVLMSPEARRCQVRLMVVLSDGQPGDQAETLAVSKRARAAGVDMLGVFLEAGARYHYNAAAEQRARLREAANRLTARLLWPDAKVRQGWSTDPTRRKQVEDASVQRFPLDGTDPWEVPRLEAACSQQRAAQLSAAMGGVPSCCITQASDLARAAVPALRALVSRYAGERV